MPWTLILAEAEGDPPPALLEKLPGLRRLRGRVHYYPGLIPEEERRRALPFGEHPEYGKVYARPFAWGETLEELRAHPAYREIHRGLLEAYLRSLLSSQEDRTREIEDLASLLGFTEDLAKLREENRKALEWSRLFRAGSIPHGLKDGRLAVGNPPVLTPESEEEVDQILRVYAWARREGVEVEPLPRRNGRLHFRAKVLLLPLEGNEVRLPILLAPRGGRTRRSLCRLVRQGKEVAVLPLSSLPPKEVFLTFSPLS